MVDTSENDFLNDRLEDLKKFLDQNSKSKMDRLKQRYTKNINVSHQSPDWKKGNPSKETFPNQFKNIQDDFFFLERDFLYRGSLYFLLEKPNHVNEPSLIELRDLFIKSADKFSSLLSQLLKDDILDLQIVLRLCFMYLRIIASVSRLSVSQQMPEFSGSKKRSSPAALYYGETNLKSNLEPKRAYSFFRGLISSIVGPRDITVFFFIISNFSVSEHLIELCFEYLDRCLGKVGRGDIEIDLSKERNSAIEKGLSGLLLKNPEMYRQMQFGLSNRLSDSHQEYLKGLKSDLYYLQEMNKNLYDLGTGVDPLRTKLIILYWLNLIKFPEKTFKQSATKKIENLDYFTVSADELTLSQEHYEVKVKAYSEKSDSDITHIPELSPLPKLEKDVREDYELKEIAEETTVPTIISLSNSLFNFETYDDLSFLKVTDKSMFPSFDVGDLLIIKDVNQFRGYDQNYVIEVSGSLEIRRIIKTGNLEEDRGVLSPTNQEFKEAEVSIPDLHIRGLVVGVFKSLEEPIN